MGDTGFAGRNITTTTVTTNTAVQTNLRYDPRYLKTLPGILKCVQAACSLLGFIFIQASVSFVSKTVGSLFSIISMIGFWCTGILLVFYIFHVIEKFYKVPWLKFEMIFSLIMTVTYLIISISAVTFGSPLYDVAGFFGFCAMVAYGFDAFLKFRAVRSGELAQGERVIAKQTTTPTY